MNVLELILYTRSGCCLCEGLEQKLQKIFLEDLCPQLKLVVIDIDGEAVKAAEREKFSLEVPVLCLKSIDKGLTIKLPRVSPRLTQQALLVWLQKMIYETMSVNPKLSVDLGNGR